MLDKAHSRILIDRHYVGTYTYMLRFISLNDIFRKNVDTCSEVARVTHSRKEALVSQVLLFYSSFRNHLYGDSYSR